jgi:hypothetical protein
MVEQYKISDVLADDSNPAHEAVKSIVEGLQDGSLSLCGCLGAMYGEPYCPCEMERKGLKEVMENNPIRKAAEYDSAQRWKKFMDEGGFEKLRRKG